MNELVEGRCVDRGDMKCAAISADEFEKYRLTRGDILFNRTNSFEHVGRTGIFDFKVWQLLFRVLPDPTLHRCRKGTSVLRQCLHEL